MCLFWTCKYTLCNCVWDRPPTFCPNMSICPGLRMVTLESHTATCAECWARGDKRVSEGETCDNTAKEGPYCVGDTSTGCSDDDFEIDETYFEAEEFPLLNPSRPTTPYLYAEILSELCPIEDDNEFDLSRVCDPVNLASIGKDYRARRQGTQGLVSWEDASGTQSFVSCQEFLEDQAPDEDIFYEETLEEEVLPECILDEEDTDFTNKGEDKNAYYSMLGSFTREKTPLERLEDESLEFYGSSRNYYGEWAQKNNFRSRLYW